MKTLLFAAALSFSSVAIAQNQDTDDADATEATTTQTAQPTQPMQPMQPMQPSGQTVDDPSQSTGPRGVTQQGTDPNGQAVAPAGANRGVAVGPGGTVPAANQSAVFTPRPAAGEYPPCSRTVTDNCIQTYEVGVRRSRNRRR